MTSRSLASASALLVASFACLSACGTTSRHSVSHGAEKVRDGFGDAVSAPLEDLNIKRHEIPPVLLRAEANPYDMAHLERCEAIAGEVGALDDALGPDLDEPPAPEGPDEDTQRADKASQLTLEAVSGASRSLIPFHGWVRRLTGAERHSKEVQAAIQAGAQRRGYLKGFGMRMNCAPPAAPSWFRPVSVVAPTPAPAPAPALRRRSRRRRPRA